MPSENYRARDSARKRATGRHKARAIAMKRKEEYLGARVPTELRNKVIRRADELGVPVSMLIRDVLMAAFGESHAGMTLSHGKITGAGSAMEPGFASVLGWENMRLNRSAVCARCGIELAAGSSVTVGISDAGGRHIVLCASCKEAV